jgi:hypothetical protein
MVLLKSVSKWALLVFYILEAILCVRSSPGVKFSEPIFLSVLALLKDGLDDQRGGSECEPIKILLEGD